MYVSAGRLFMLIYSGIQSVLNFALNNRAFSLSVLKNGSCKEGRFCSAL